MLLKEKTIKYFEHRSCKCKMSYQTLQNGLQTLFECRDKKGWDVNNVYKCLFCNKYHIGHYSDNTRKKVKQILELKV